MRTSDEEKKLFSTFPSFDTDFFEFFFVFCFFNEKLKMSTIYVAMQKRIPPITRSKRNDKMTAKKKLLRESYTEIARTREKNDNFQRASPI